MDSNFESRVRDLVRSGIEEKIFPGCQVLVSVKGETILNAAFGWHDYEKSRPVDLHSVYDLASVSKATATLSALMAAIDEYGISVDDKLSDYIPELIGTDKEKVSLRETLLHESLIQSWLPFYKATQLSNGRWDPYWISATKTDIYCNQIAEGLYIRPEFRQELIRRIATTPRLTPGDYRYSCLNFALLRQVIETVTKQRLDVYLAQKVLAPMGLGKCGYNPRGNVNIKLEDIVPTEIDRSVRRQRLTGFVHDELSAWSGGVEGNAGFFSSATELLPLLAMFLSGGVDVRSHKRIIAEQTVRLFTQTRSTHTHRGLGFNRPDVVNLAASPCAAEVPSTVYGHTGFTGTCFWIDPDNSIIFIFLSNRVWPDRQNDKILTTRFRQRLQSLIYTP